MSPPPAQAGSADALFVFAEDDVTHLHIGSCAVFEGPAPSLAELTEAVCSALPRVARFRHLARFLPGDLDRPMWVDAPGFEPADHVHAASLPEPGDDRALGVLMSSLMSGGLPCTRPLWEMWLVDCMIDGRWAIVSKVHPCLVDRSGGSDLLSELLDTAGGLWSFARILKPWTPHQPAEPQWAFARCRLKDIRDIQAAFGGSVNDVVLAVIADAFHDLWSSHGANFLAPEFSALVPAARRDGEDERVDHAVPMVLVQLPMDVAEPLERLTPAREVLPASLFTWALHTTAALVPLVPKRTVNTVVTNMPGPSQPLYVLGCQMLEYLPFLPIGESPRLGVAAITYNGGCTFGITGDRGSAGGAGFLAGRLEAAAQGLLELARTTPRSIRTAAEQP